MIPVYLTLIPKCRRCGRSTNHQTPESCPHAVGFREGWVEGYVKGKQAAMDQMKVNGLLNEIDGEGASA